MASTLGHPTKVDIMLRGHSQLSTFLKAYFLLIPFRKEYSNMLRSHCLRQKKVDLHTFRRQEKYFINVLLYMKATNVCILYILITCLNKVLSCCTHSLYNGENEVGPDSRHVLYF